MTETSTYTVVIPPPLRRHDPRHRRQRRRVDYLTFEDTRADIGALYQALGYDDPEEAR